MDTLSEADLDAASLHWTTNHDDRRAADADDRRIAFTVVPLANPMVVGDMKRVSPTFSARRCPDLLRPSDAVAPARKIPRGFTTQIGARIAVTEVVGDDKDNVRLPAACRCHGRGLRPRDLCWTVRCNRISGCAGVKLRSLLLICRNRIAGTIV